MTLAANPGDVFPPLFAAQATRALRVALAVSVALHVLLLAGYLAQVQEPRRSVVKPSAGFEITLLSPKVSVEPKVRMEPEEGAKPRPVSEVSPPDESPLTPLNSPRPKEVVSTEKPASTSRSSAPVGQEPAPAAMLNLQRPEHWEAIALEPPDEEAGLVFKRSSRTALIKRRQEQEASRALSRSQIARLGLPAEQFRRRTDAGEEVKTSKGCFVKRVEQGPTGAQERWWRTACNDSRKSAKERSAEAWKREILSYGPIQRAH